MTDKSLSTFAERMDRCWMERRFDDLAGFLSPDIVMVAPDAKRVEGAQQAVASYREFMTRCRVLRFERTEQHVTERGDAAVVEYRWDMEWDDGEDRHAALGREALVLARSEAGWRVIWRTQLPA
jgi:ketosteroid isomerase-like protein